MRPHPILTLLFAALIVGQVVLVLVDYRNRGAGHETARGALGGATALVIAGQLALEWKRARRRRRQVIRRAGGLCVKCGYDLRASGKSCPECGTPVPPPLSRL